MRMHIDTDTPSEYTREEGTRDRNREREEYRERERERESKGYVRVQA
jgi:hypothetical protein